MDLKIHQSGYIVNCHHNDKLKSDMKLSVEQMKESFPNLKWVGLQVPWFATSLSLKETRIMPKIEYKHYQMPWQVAEFSRDDVQEVTRDENNSPIFGGTPTDESVKELCQALRKQNLKIMLIPVLNIDDKTKPWAGFLTTKSNIKDLNKEMDNFFNDKKYGYNKFILHYANLLKNDIDAFSIGYELKGITLKPNKYQQFPGVEHLVSLLDEVKSILGASVKTTYIANYGEYHHAQDGRYALDLLWGNDNLDIVTIATNIPINSEHKNCKDIKLSWQSGDGYDYYYAGKTKIYFDDSTWAWKNFKFWYENFHYDGNIITPWNPEQKKQFNIIYDPNAKDIAIAASEMFFKEQGIISQAFLSYYDSRPFPFYPENCKIWSDCDMWKEKSLINGKLNDAFIDIETCV
jgi:hypothetical protein